jgi:hypothetical protein
MMWNASIVIRFGVPIVGREAKAMETFANAITTFGGLAAEGKCSDVEVFNHLFGGGMMVVKTESFEDAHEILEMEDVRKIVETAIFTVDDFDVELMVTGQRLMDNMSEYTAIGTELGYI